MPSYFKDNRQVEQHVIVALAEKMQIQTSNLCQFLPQDVVREFPEMKAEKIFHNTLRAVGNLAMLEKHDGLKDKQEGMI
jgi:putative heme iron utilization protein